MKKLGLIGGISWQATAAYYETLQTQVSSRLGPLRSGHILINSLDFAEFVALQEVGDWDAVTALLVNAARDLEAAGAEAFMICCNTVHKVAAAVSDAVGIPLLHIADATAAAVKKQGLEKVGLMGTIYTMREDFYRGYLERKHGISVVVPNQEDQQFINDVIFDEIGAALLKDSSRTEYLRCIDRLAAKGAQGVILGCTEIPLLVSQDDTHIPVFDSTQIHARAGADWMLGDGSSS